MTVPVLNGLILAGGKSLRMGSDKSLLDYHGRPQREYLYDLLQPFCNEIFISCNAAQANAISLPHIEDAYPDTGPLGGLLSALKAYPGKAWLVVACDLPCISHATFKYLVDHRDAGKCATVFASPEDGLPEPLVAIWEPETLQILLQAMSKNDLSLRSVLKQMEIEMLPPPAPLELQNVNDPIIFAEAITRLRKQPLSNASPS